jgi:uncharacterized protein
MEQRITAITLGVAEISRARRFYCDGLGWKAARGSDDSVVFIDLNGIVLALFGREALAEDASLDSAGSGFRAIALAHNVREPAEVDVVLALAERAGATIVKPAQATFWGGYAGYFADPDGHVWEVAHNPGWPLDADGRVALPSAE